MNWMTFKNSYFVPSQKINKNKTLKKVIFYFKKSKSQTLLPKKKALEKAITNTDNHIYSKPNYQPIWLLISNLPLSHYSNHSNFFLFMNSVSIQFFEQLLLQYKPVILYPIRREGDTIPSSSVSFSHSEAILKNKCSGS